MLYIVISLNATYQDKILKYLLIYFIEICDSKIKFQTLSWRLYKKVSVLILWDVDDLHEKWSSKLSDLGSEMICWLVKMIY